MTKATTLIRAGVVEIPLREVLGKYTEKLTQVSAGRSDTEKYFNMSSKPPYFMMFSYTKGVERINPLKYNSLASVTSCSDDWNKSLLDKFERETGIAMNLRPHPAMQNMFDSFGDMIIGILEKSPEEAIRFFSGDHSNLN